MRYSLLTAAAVVTLAAMASSQLQAAYTYTSHNHPLAAAGSTG